MFENLKKNLNMLSEKFEDFEDPIRTAIKGHEFAAKDHGHRDIRDKPDNDDDNDISRRFYHTLGQ